MVVSVRRRVCVGLSFGGVDVRGLCFYCQIVILVMMKNIKCTFYHKQVSLYLLYVWCAKFSSENSTRRETSTCLAEKPQTRTFSHCNRKLYISVAVSYFLFRTLKIV